MTCAWPNCRHVQPRCAARTCGCTLFDGQKLTDSRKRSKRAGWVQVVLIASLTLALGCMTYGALSAAERTYQMEARV